MLFRGRRFCPIAVYLQEHMVNVITQIFKLRGTMGHHVDADGGDRTSPMASHVGYKCYGRLRAIVIV
jgi:hypothetical protein